MDYETPQFYRVMQYAAATDRDVVDMVSGTPDWDPPDALREGVRQYADADPSDFQYAASAGLRGLRAEIAQRRGVDTDQVIVTNGTGEANHLAMAGGLDSMSGTEIILTDPVYPYYAGRANFLGADTTPSPSPPTAAPTPRRSPRRPVPRRPSSSPTPPITRRASPTAARPSSD